MATSKPSNNSNAAVDARKSTAVNKYNLSTYYTSMLLVKNLAVLIEQADILSAQAQGQILTAYLNQSDLETAMSNVTATLGLSTAAWTILSAVTRDIYINDLNDYLDQLRRSLEHTLAVMTGTASSGTEEGLFKKLKGLAAPGEYIHISNDLEKIKAMYIPHYIPVIQPVSAGVRPASALPAQVRQQTQPAQPVQPAQPPQPSNFTAGQTITFNYKGSPVTGTIVQIEAVSGGRDYKLTIDLPELGEQKKFMESFLHKK